VSASAGSGAAGIVSCAAGGCARVRVGDVSACGGDRPEGVRGKAPKGRPRREHDVAAPACGHRARQGRGGVVARSWRGKAGVRLEVRAGSAVLVCAGACVRAAR
jgi:hypothetical protein